MDVEFYEALFFLFALAKISLCCHFIFVIWE